MSTPIEYMETDELLQELKKRFDELMFIGYKQQTKREDSYQIAVKSSLHGSYGLIEVLTRATEAHDEGD
jgi:lipid A disaccharide synthetase